MEHSIYLVRGTPFIGGHIFQYITKGKQYPVISLKRGMRLIKDDNDKEVWVSNTLFRKYWRNQ